MALSGDARTLPVFHTAPHPLRRATARRRLSMHVVNHAHLPHLHVGSELCIPAADRSRGVTGFEVWVRTLDAGAQTAALRHDGELVVLALAGGGKLLLDGGPQRFHAPCTLLIPAGHQFRIVNQASTPLQLVWVFTAAPVPWDCAAGS